MARLSLRGRREMPQHMDALALANEVRLKRSALKGEVARGEVSVVDVIAEPPECARSMGILELLMAQHRWGRTRSLRVLRRVQMLETKALGAMTDRQRRALLEVLEFS